MVPATHAVSRPSPTNPAKPGSWPDPPPLTTEMFEGVLREAGWRYMILFGISATIEGLVRVNECSASWTALIGSVRKCFAAG